MGRCFSVCQGITRCPICRVVSAVATYHLFGIREKTLSYLLGMMSLVLYGVATPNIDRANTIHVRAQAKGIAIPESQRAEEYSAKFVILVPHSLNKE